MFKKAFIVLLLSFISSSLWAAQVNKSASEFKWLGTKVTGKHWGKIAIKQADVQLNKGQIVGGQIVMDMNSITVDDIQGDTAKKFLKHIKSDDFFNVGKFPTASLKINNVLNNYLFGQLTIKGKTHPVKVPIKQVGSTYTGQLVFDRTQFDMVYGSGNFFKNLGDKVIHDEVKIDFKLVLKK